MNHAGALRTRWIVSREFDVSLFFGGAALSLLVLVPALVLRVTPGQLFSLLTVESLCIMIERELSKMRP